jgi:electron transfer flavoprotein alpha subunit
MKRVIAVTWDESLTSATLEALGSAGAIAAAASATFEVAAFNPAASLAAGLGAYGVQVFTALTGDPETADIASVLASLTGTSRDTLVVMARGPWALEVAPRLAVKTGGACVMGVVGGWLVDGGDIEATAAIFGGAARARYAIRGDGPRIAALWSGPRAQPVATPVTPTVSTVEIPSDPRLTLVTPPRPPEGAQIETAEVVVSGGRGLREGANFGLVRDLAATLGGLPGASRAIVDSGWARPDEQVGLTGRIVTPAVYFAFGISGASQHMAGCSNAQTIVAVNTDPDAPIFRYAHIGVVGDCLALLPELIAQARAGG